MKHNAVYILLAVLSLTLYGFLPAGWWYSDDPVLATFASVHTVTEILFKPEIWQSFSPFNLTPWVILSLKIDEMLAGFEPQFYYLHHIIVLTITVLAVFAVFSLYLKERLSSFIGSVIFLLHPATLAVASWISTRHYLEGLCFGLISIYFYVKALRNSRPLLLAFSTLFYVLALISKEVYAPLPFLFILLPEQGLKKRIRYVLPAFIMAVLYIAYRAWMLGDNMVGGYSSIWTWTLKSALLRTPEIMQGYSDSWWPLLVIAIVVIWSFYILDGWKGRLRRALRGFLLFSLFYLPIIPVNAVWGGLSSSRYFFTLSLFITFCYVSSVDLLFEKQRAIQTTLAIILALAVIGGFYYGFRGEKALWESEKAVAHSEGGFFMEYSDRLDAIFRITQPHWFFDGLEKIKTAQSGKNTERKLILVVGDFYGLDRKESMHNLELFSYDKNSKKVVDISLSASKRHNAFLKTLQNKPLNIFMTIRRGIMKLRLGPYEGRYTLLEASPSQPGYYHLALPINRAFGIKLTHREKNRIFRIAFTSPEEGWITLSPEFLVDWSKDQTVQWSRG
jgi:hypothetical protein